MDKMPAVAIAIEPPSAASFHARGDAYRSAGAYDRAVADYSEAVRLDAKFEAAYLHRAEALIAKHDFDGALADLDRVVDLDPNCANTRNIQRVRLQQQRRIPDCHRRRHGSDHYRAA